MANKETSAATPAVRAALAGLVDDSARVSRVAASQRADLSKLLSAKDVRKMADSDAELSAAIENTARVHADADAASAAWQKDLAEAAKRWQAALAELSQLHGDA